MAGQENTSVLRLVGGGGHGLVVAEAATSAGWKVLGFHDDDPLAVCGIKAGLTRLGGFDQVEVGGRFVIAVGDLGLRRRLAGELGRAGAAFATVTSAAAYVSPTAAVGAGVFVGPRAVVHALARVSDHAIINTGAIVEHECEIGENVHVAPGAVLGGNVTVGKDSLVGIGARVLPGVRIGTGCVVGGGAVVARDVADGSTVVGVPARSR